MKAIEQINNLKRRMNEEQAKIESLLEEARKKIEEIYNVSAEEPEKIREALEEIRNLKTGLLMTIKKEIIRAKSTLKNELLSVKMAISKLPAEERRELREQYRELGDRIDGLIEYLEDSFEETKDSLIDLEYYVRNLVKEMKKARKYMVKVGAGELVIARGEGPTVVISSIRLSREDAEMIDLLVEAGVFRSRSEAVSYFTKKGIEASRELLENVKKKLEELRQIRDALKKEFKP